MELKLCWETMIFTEKQSIFRKLYENQTFEQRSSVRNIYVNHYYCCKRGPGHLVENGLSTFICMTLNSSEDKIQRGTIKILDSSKWSTRKSFMNHTLQKHKVYVKMMFWGIHIFIVFDCLWICLSHSDFPFLSVNYVFSASPASELGGEWYSRSRKLSLF